MNFNLACMGRETVVHAVAHPGWHIYAPESLRGGLMVKYKSHIATHSAMCASVCQWVRVRVSVKAHLITGFHCSHSQTAWCLANPHNAAHTEPSLLYHYIISGSAAPSLVLCWSLQLSPYRRVQAAVREGEKQRFGLMKSSSDCYVLGGCSWRGLEFANPEHQLFSFHTMIWQVWFMVRPVTFWGCSVKVCVKKKITKMGEDSPSIHGEISVEHPLAHLLPLNSPGKFKVRELIS